MNIAWIDLETTGLNAEECGIIEVASVITDKDYKILDMFDAPVFPSFGCRIESTAKEMHRKSGLWGEALDSSITHEQADATVSEMLGNYQEGNKPLILGGSSVHFDHEFIRNWMPHTDKKLHYRHLDLSSLKIFFSNASGIPTEELPPLKSETKHRALSDILDSIEAARWYRDVGLDVDSVKRNTNADQSN